MKTDLPEGKILIQFDGLCVLCSRTVRFIMNADRKKKFVFRALQQISENQSFETLIVTEGKTSYRYFDAVLKIGHELGGLYRMVAIFKVLPPKWRLLIYKWIAIVFAGSINGKPVICLPKTKGSDLFKTRIHHFRIECIGSINDRSFGQNLQLYFL